MKKLLLLLFFIPFALTLNSCDALYTGQSPTVNSNKWIERTIPPSQVTTSGAMFYEEELKTDMYNTVGGTFSVGGYIEEDGTYWYNQVMQDLGWRTNTEGGWSSVGSNYTRIKRGYLYINLKKRVAVYFYEGSTFNAFRVTINEKETE